MVIVVIVVTALSFLFMSLLPFQTLWFLMFPWSEVVALCYTADIHVGFSDSCLWEAGQWWPLWVIITVAHDLKGKLAFAVPLWSASPHSDK